MSDANLRFWGVRGSIAAPGKQTSTVGGNTACVELRLAGQRIILDGGTGLRKLGMAQGAEPLVAHVLFGHLHWDHIQGVPFCGPLFNPASRVTMMGPPGLEQALARQMSLPTFPVTMEAMGADIEFQPLAAGASLDLGQVRVTTAPLNHPGGGVAYRLEGGGHSVVYACDTEHPASGLDADLLRLARGATVLIYDAQFLPDEYPSRVGWGHSTYADGARLARAAGVEQLVLTHHDPNRDDTQVHAVEQAARVLFPATRAAREGEVLELDQMPKPGLVRRSGRAASSGA